MADTKTTALTELTTFSGDETFYVVEDDDGTPVSRKVTVENLAIGMAGQIGVYATYTPTIKGGATTVTTSALVARYCQIGKVVHAYGSATVSSAGAANGVITVTVPVGASTATDGYPSGTGEVQDVSNANGRYRALVANIATSSGFIRFFRDATVNDVEVGASPAFTLASGDIIKWNITYEAA